MISKNVSLKPYNTFGIDAKCNEFGKVRLFCWCAPKRCHGETIKKWLIEKYGDK